MSRGYYNNSTNNDGWGDGLGGVGAWEQGSSNSFSSNNNNNNNNNNGGYNGSYGGSSYGGGGGGGGRSGGSYASSSSSSSSSINPFNNSEENWTREHQKMYSTVDTISQNVSQLQRSISKVGTFDDNLQLRTTIKEKLEETRRAIKQAGDSMKSLQAMEDQGGNAAENSKRRRVLGRLNKDFQGCISKFKDIAKLWMQKERQSIPARSGNASNIPGGGDQYYQQPPSSNFDNPPVPFGQYSAQQFAQVDSEVEVREYLAEETDAQVRKIESDMAEVNLMFKDFHSLVQDQQVFIDSIENNIEAAVVHTYKGVEELDKASEHAKSANSKTFCIAMICVVILAIIVAITALGITIHYVF